MVLYDLFQVLADNINVRLYNSIGKQIYYGYLSQLDATTLMPLVLHITPMSYNEIIVGIDTKESEVKL